MSQPDPASGRQAATTDTPNQDERGDTSRTGPASTAAQPTMLEQMGGISGLVYSAIPVVAFVLVNSFFGLTAAIWASIGVAVGITLLRLVRKEPLQPAFSGLFGVAIAAFIAYKTGSAKDYFLLGIWINLVYCAGFLGSALVRWPLAGVLWSMLNGTGMGWRADKQARRYYDIATLVWILVFGSKFVVQRWLYDEDQVGWLAFARIGMGYPLTAIAILVTIWAVRQADKRQKELSTASTR